ncbi:c-type cytochrome biogenesis protein CcmI [Vibrio sp. SCSIO 43137]|uniref:c-type cytochrome biogenesis protein CcmI n=1 Tax=Vibrio sp. SCSIO 43137 TaxID=3021011 RepID=UPI002306F8E3|nr:c-type cytochrome biogenesis protein CcmI [Vibrio sp. SCSIO 43137]WCE28945.1 c-type cytochrome biogenesis protein CcmI [Vibrio sp. SCSIO 43137]
MTTFWISAIILLAASAVFIALPLFRKQSFDDDARRDELNKAFYKDRLEELEEEASEGVVSDSDELIQDLKLSLLDDIPSDEKQKGVSSFSPMQVFIPSFVLVVAVSFLLYFKFGAMEEVTHWQDINGQLPALTKKLMAPEGESLTDEEMADLTLALRTRLHYQPKDSAGWLLLGRIALANRDGSTATGAMKRAYTLKPDDPDAQLGYAQAMMMSQDDAEHSLARSLLIGLIQNNYVDLRVYSLLAFDSYQRQEYTEAIRYWRTMQKLIGPEDNRYNMLERSISNAEKALGKLVSDINVPVTISLSDSAQLPDNASLIVSVHDGNGSPIPMAAARFPLGSFPRTVVLDDGNVMIEGQSLSSLKTILVKVRVDIDGNVATKEGDWYGQSPVVELGKPVALSIDKQY